MANKSNKPRGNQESTTCLFLTKNHHRYLLTHNESHYLLVKINHKKIQTLSSILLSKNAGSLEAWRKKDFPARGIPKQSLHYVFLKGHEKIEEIELKFGQEALTFQLSQTYGEETFREFFPVHLVSRQYITQEDIQHNRDIQFKVTTALHIFSVIACLGLLFYPRPYWLWVGLCITAQLIGLILPLWKPLLFNITDQPKGTPWIPGNLIWVHTICGFGLLFRMTTAFTLNTPDVLLVLALTSVVALPLCGLYVRRSGIYGMSPFRTFLLFLGIWIMMIFLGIGTVAHIAHLFAKII